MKMHRLLGSTIAASVLAIAAGALADPQLTQKSEGPSNLSAFTGNDESLGHAIASIQRATGGQVLEIRFQNNNRRGVYNAVVSKNGEISNSRVDASTGRILAMNQQETPDWMLNWHSQRDVKSLEKAGVPLSEAIMTAEKAGSAPAVDAGLAKPLAPDNDVLAYNVELVKNGRPMRVAVDATNNEVIQNTNLFETWSPER